MLITNRAQPAVAHAPITPSDSTVIKCSALFVLAAGNLVIEDAAGITVTYAVTPGLFPFAPAKVKAATTATVVAWR